MTLSRKDLIKQFIRENDLKTVKDVQDALKDIFAETLQGMLEAEMNNHLGYSKYNYKNKETSNSRNGKYSRGWFMPMRLSCCTYLDNYFL